MIEAYDSLAALAEVGAALADETVEREASALSEQLERHELNLLVVGQFKRGKSSVVNALLEEDLMPTGALPVTSIAVAVRYGAEPSVRVTFPAEMREVDAGEFASYVSESANPRNVRGVVRIDVVRPVPALRGITLYDTPGVGSIFDHNTAAAHALLTRTDAAILVVGPEPPIGAEELAYARNVAASSVRLFVVFNKEDIAGPSREELLRFTGQALKDVAQDATIYPLSATRARAAQRSGTCDAAFDAFTRALRLFVDEHGDEALKDSVRRRVGALLGRSRALVRMREQAAALPYVERARRQEELEHALQGLDDRIRFLELAVDDDVKRLRTKLEEHLNARHDDELAAFVQQSERIARETGTRRREELERVVRERAEAWRDDAVTFARNELAVCTVKYARVLAEIEEAVLRAGCNALHVSGTALEPREIAFAPARLTTAVSVDPTTSLEVVRDALTAIFPPATRVAIVRKRLAFVLERELDALRGKLRYGIAHDLEPWRQSVQSTIASSLNATRTAVLAAFSKTDAAGAAPEEASVGVLAERIRRVERVLTSVAT